MVKQDKYSSEETRHRFAAILRGAMHKPTPLKDVPKKDGGSRKKARSKKPTRP